MRKHSPGNNWRVQTKLPTPSLQPPNIHRGWIWDPPTFLTSVAHFFRRSPRGYILWKLTKIIKFIFFISFSLHQPSYSTSNIVLQFLHYFSVFSESLIAGKFNFKCNEWNLLMKLSELIEVLTCDVLSVFIQNNTLKQESTTSC